MAAEYDPIERMKARAQGSSGSMRVSKFRDSMRALGMVQVNMFIPEADRERILAQGEAYRAAYMQHIVETEDVTSDKRMIVADRNFATMPTRHEIDYLEHMNRAHRLNLAKEIAGIRDMVTECNKTKGALNLAEEDDEVIRLASKAVAISNVLSASYKLLRLDLDEEVRRIAERKGEAVPSDIQEDEDLV